MPDYDYEGDPTEPIAPRPQGSPEPGKLVLGNFQESPQSPRQPYKYSGPDQGGRPQRSPQQPPQGNSGYPQNPPPRQPGYPQNPPPTQPAVGRQGMQDVNYGYKAGQMRPSTPAPERSRQRPRRRNGCAIGCLSALIILVILVVVAFNVMQHVLAFGSAISTKSPLSTETSYMGITDRTNLLVLGYGGGTHDGAFLTDSMVVFSVQPQSHHTSLVSVPRDLWVQYPANSGSYTKINSLYQYASNNNKDPNAGGQAIDQKIALVTGMNVKYWLTIDFSGFKKVVDSVGGIDVYVPDSFNACYPKNDDAAVDASWIKVQFNKGMQHMDGATAIEYARAREPLEVCGKGTSENLAELTDFGRSARQQIIIKAVLSKVKQASTWPKMYGAMNALQQTIRTNMSFADLASFALKMDLTDPKAAHIGLSNQNVLMDSQSSDGQYILQPANGDWNAIPPYIQKNLYP
jgi:LCP family protein required for cell wall assembly